MNAGASSEAIVPAEPPCSHGAALLFSNHYSNLAGTCQPAELAARGQGLLGFDTEDWSGEDEFDECEF